MEVEIIETKKGHRVVKIKTVDLMKVCYGSLGICDSCNSGALVGYYIPVLSKRWYCEKCYKKWVEEAIFYQEDIIYEERELKAFVSECIRAGLEVKYSQDLKDMGGE